MATYYLCSPVQAGGYAYRPGRLVSSTDASYGILEAAGALLWPSSDSYVAAGAKLAAKAQSKGADDDVLEALMYAACFRSLMSEPGPTPPTPSGATIVPFGPSTPSPMVLQAVVPGSVLIMSRIVVVTAFDDARASSALGTSADPGLVFAPGDASMSVPGTYSNDEVVEFSSPDQLWLSVAPRSSINGAALLVYSMGVG